MTDLAFVREDRLRRRRHRAAKAPATEPAQAAAATRQTYLSFISGFLPYKLRGAFDHAPAIACDHGPTNDPIGPRDKTCILRRWQMTTRTRTIAADALASSKDAPSRRALGRCSSWPAWPGGVLPYAGGFFNCAAPAADKLRLAVQKTGTFRLGTRDHQGAGTGQESRTRG